jgi:hypothetical protein
MVFKTRPKIKKQFDTVYNFGIKNLVVSGCSFTYNNSDEHLCTWPYYLRDLGGFEQVLDCSMPGAGNYHIANTLQWALEINQPDPDNSLVIVMWSGFDRDDYVSPISNDSNVYPFKFYYDKHTISGITGGSDGTGRGNTISGLDELAKTKNQKSRTIEHYLTINSLQAYLINNGYQFIFLNFIDRQYAISPNFDIVAYLPKKLKSKFLKMFTEIDTLWSYAVRYDLFEDDQFHPDPDAHLEWTRNILLPALHKKKDLK